MSTNKKSKVNQGTGQGRQEREREEWALLSVFNQFLQPALMSRADPNSTVFAKVAREVRNNARAIR